MRKNDEDENYTITADEALTFVLLSSALTIIIPLIDQIVTVIDLYEEVFKTIPTVKSDGSEEVFNKVKEALKAKERLN